MRRELRRRSCRATILLGAWLAPDALHAQAVDDGARPPAAQDAALLADAERELSTGNFEEARALFVAAHARAPGAATHRGLALAECALRDYPACLAHADAALVATGAALDDAQREELQRVRAQAQDSVGWLTLATRPTASALRLDGALVAFAPGQPLMIAAGEHVLEADAPGFATETRQFRLAAGQVEPLALTFDHPLTRRRWYRSPWLWTAVGVVAAGAAAGAAVALRGSGAKTAPAFGGSTDTVGSAP